VISGQTNTVVETILVPGGPQGITFDSTNGDLYVTDYNINTVSIISGETNTLIGSPITVGSHPFAFSFLNLSNV